MVEGTACTADDLLPLLVLVIVRANPPHLVSNIEYVAHFRNQACIGTEAHYNLTSFVSAVSFIRGADASSLTIDPAEYDRLTKVPPAERAAYLHSHQEHQEHQTEQEDRDSSEASDTECSLTSSLSASLDVACDDVVALHGSSSSPAQSNLQRFKFCNVEAGDLRLSDVPELLAEYKWLVRRVALLEQQQHKQQQQQRESQSKQKMQQSD